MRTWRVGAITVLLGLCLLEGAASAEEGTAAVLPMQGPQAAKVRQRVHSGLRSADVSLVPLKKVTTVAKKTKGYAKQANKLGATVLIGGRIRRSGDRWIADVGIRNAKGVRVQKFRAVSSSVSRLSSRIVTVLMGSGKMPTKGKDEGVKKIGVAAPAAAPVAASEPPPRASTTPHLVVRPFKGGQAAKIRGAAMRGFKGKPVELVSNKQFAKKAQKLNVDLDSNRGHVRPAREMGVDALLEGDVVREDGIWSAYVRMVDGGSADVISQHYYEADSSSALAREVQGQIWDDFRKDVRRFAPAGAAAFAAAPPPEKTKDRKRKEKKKKDKKPRAKRDKLAAVDIEFDFKFVHRNLTWNDAVTPPRDYTLGFGPGVQTKFQYYPGAHFTSGVGAQFGVDFEWERLFNFDSTQDNGGTVVQFPTTAQQFLIGARWRYPAGRWEPTIFAGYGVQKFELRVIDPIATPGLPNTKYKFIRAGAGFRVAAGKREAFIITVNGAFRYLLSAGGIESDQFFPAATGNGMDALVMLGYALPKGFEIRISGDYRRYWFDLNPVPPDPPFVAGGALDQYGGFAIGAAWRY